MSAGRYVSVGLAAVAAVSAISHHPLRAQTTRPLASPPGFALDQWTTKQGLPQNSVTSIAMTPDGFLWVGTFGGLARFDGASFTVQERVDSTGRHVDRIRSLATAPDGALWIGTENGLFRYEDGAYDLYTTADGLRDDNVVTVYVDRTGTVWVATQQGGIARLVDGRFELVREVEGEPFDNVIQVREDRQGTLWLGAAGQFVTVEHGDPTTMRWRPAPAAEIELLELHDRQGAYWFRQPGGVVQVSQGRVRRYDRRDGVRAPSLMIEDPGNGYWLGTYLDGLFYFEVRDDGQLVARRYALPDGRTAYNVRSALVDADGNLWFGTDADGLLRAKRNLFTTYAGEHGLSHDVVTAVYGDASGTMWVGTNCFGVNAIDPARRTIRLFKPRRSGDPEGDPCIFALTEAPDGTMWAGTWGGGLSHITGGRTERLRHLPGLRDSVILALFTDRSGTVWVGTNTAGVAALDGGQVRATYTTEDGLAHNSVRTIYQTRDDALWIGTLEGVSRLADGRITNYTAAQGLSAEHVRAIHEDADGSLWIGTYGGGINRLREGTFIPVTRKEGLADDVVSRILEDDRGYFWLSGNRGVSRVARGALIALTEGRVARVHSTLYGQTDGLRNPETNGGFQPAGWKDAQGRLWFPTVQGVAVVDPARVAVLERAPSVKIEHVIVDGEPRAPAGTIELGPGRPNLEFQYAGLSLSAPEHLTFRYRLEGFDDAWVDAGVRRIAYYPRLPSGRYRFVVTAANRDGVWNEAGAAIDLSVIAPLWQRWSFRLAVTLALLGLVAGVAWRRSVTARRARAEQEEFSRLLIESQEHERKRLARELHDGLGQELLVIKNRALLALRADGLQAPARDQLQLIGDVVTQSLEAVRGMAHQLTPHQLDHLGLSAALRAMIDGVAASTEIEIEHHIEDVDGLLPIDGEINLYRIVQEALSNVVRHSGASQAQVSVRQAWDSIVVTVTDDGRGFRVRRHAHGRTVGGFGLSSMAERARILGGRAVFDSAPGRGTRLDLTVPIAASQRSRT